VEFNKDIGKEQKGKPNTRRIRLVDNIYYFYDYTLKVLGEYTRNIYQFFQRFIAIVFAKIFLVISVFFVNPFTDGRLIAYKVPLGILRILVGLVLLTVLCITALVGVLIGGTFATLLGFRNIADYSLKEQIAACLTFMIILSVLPFHLSDFWTYKITLIFCYILIIIGFDFLYGQCGIISLGHAGFVFWGAYTTAFFYTGSFGFKLPLLLSLALAAASSFLVGVLLGLPSLRIKDSYLFIITLAFTISLPQIFRSRYMSKYTGLETGGLSVDQNPPPAFLSHLMSQTIWNYFYTIGIALVLIIFAYNLLHHSQIGRAFRTIKCDVEVSTIMGIPVFKYKLLASAMSAVYAAVAGGLIMYLNRFIAPDSYGVNDSIDYIVASVIGGPGSILGSSFGGIFLVLEKDIATAVSHMVFKGDHLTRMFYGIFMILVVFIAPRGIVGELTKSLKSALIRSPKRGAYYTSPPADYDFLEMKSPTIKED